MIDPCKFVTCIINRTAGEVDVVFFGDEEDPRIKFTYNGEPVTEVKCGKCHQQNHEAVVSFGEFGHVDIILSFVRPVRSISSREGWVSFDLSRENVISIPAASIADLTNGQTRMKASGQ